MSERNPLDDLPQRDPRDQVIALAEVDLAVAINDIVTKHQITYLELVRILVKAVDRWVGRLEGVQPPVPR